ncbi:MAG TPA: hypothetical protein VIN40_05440 [Candidatus Tyrphobacter sp.]
MNRIQIVLAGLALGLAACSGEYGSGTSSPGGITPPVQQGVQNVAPGTSARPGQPTATPSAPPGDTATYALTDAVSGVRCPAVNGYSCIIHLNVPASTPTPSAKPGTAAATPQPSPSPSASASSSPAPSPSATPSITLKLEAQPHDAPVMVNANQRSVSTTALIALRITTNADIALSGTASADFILPQGQVGGRGFAVQLFHETAAPHNRHTDTFIGSYSKSSIAGTTLHFTITPPHVTSKRGETWLFVLYASELPSAGAPASPGTSVSPAASASPSITPSASPSTQP